MQLLLVFYFLSIYQQNEKYDFNVNAKYIDYSDSLLNKIENSKWRLKIAYNCVYNIYFFKKQGDYEYYSCELDDVFYGKYQIINDTIVLEQFISKRDSLIPPQSVHRSEKMKEKLVLEKKHLRLISWQSMNLKGEWGKPFILKEKILYEKVEY